MRTKLFFAFFLVIIIALVSNLIFENFMARDFEAYVNGSREDRLYWVLASVEGSYANDAWNPMELREAVHWGLMLGFDLKIDDKTGREIIDSSAVVDTLSPSMKKRMEDIVDISSAKGPYESYPLYIEGEQIGTMQVRELSRRGSIKEKENIFRERKRESLIISFVIAGGGAIFLAIFFSLFLSRPLKRLKTAVETLAKGDFGVRVKGASKKDEVGKLSRSFNFMAEALEREEALRQHLTSNIAHELRTPLAVMKANVEAMMDGVIANREEGLDNIRLEVERLIKLVEGIEDITKAEASFFSRKDRVEIDLREFLSGIATKLMPLATAKALEMAIVSSRPLSVVTDPDKLERIVQNIVTNAIRNTQKGSIRIAYGLEKQLFFVEVTDTGAGIPVERQQMIFRRFYRGADSKGIGLGLAIVNELVDVMGGRIELRSKVGEGSTFRVCLPARA
jgi:two-component system sensor histidine kinase BaeS